MYGKKKCMKCGEQATIKFTRIEKGQVYDLFLCAEHAAELSPYQKPKIPLSNILESLLKNEFSVKPSGPQAPSNLRCVNCGLAFAQYKKNLMLGCSDCYVSFRDYLIPDLRRIHGETRHHGRSPGGGMAVPPVNEVQLDHLMQDELAEAIPKEEEVIEKEALALQDPNPMPKDLLAQIEELTESMKVAIASEDYTKAARYRDQIREIKSRLEIKSTDDV